MVKVAILGSTGSVGRAIVAECSKDARITEVVAIARRPYFSATSRPPASPKLTERIVADLHAIQPSDYRGAEIVYCALGTTRADAGSAAQFLRDDRDLIIQTARVAKEAGVQNFQLTSSLGASTGSYFLYPKAKGETEESLRSLGFNHLGIWRPAGLDTTAFPRQHQRFAERLFIPVMRWTPILNRSKWANTPVEEVARAMINDSLTQRTGTKTFEGTQEILAMSKQ